MNKKLVLFLIVGVEIVFGSYFLGRYIFDLQQKAKVLGAAKVAKIDETKVMVNVDEQLAHYWEYKPNELVFDHPDWLEKAVTYSINNDGLNDTKDYSLDSADGVFRIITLGDSFTFGHYVATNQSWPEVLEKKLNQMANNCYSAIEVINLGMPGFDVQEIVNRYKRIGQKYSPDLVLWFESGSGFYRFNNVMQPKIKDCVDQKAKENESGEATPDEIGACWSEATDFVVKNYSDDYRSQMLKTELANFFSLVEISKTIFVYNEEVKEYGMDFISNFEQSFPGFKVYFTASALDQPTARLFDGHPSPVGHERIADQVYKILLDNKIICNNN